MRILVTGFTSHLGGVENFIMNYYRQMQEIDSNIVMDILVTTSEPVFKEEIIQRGGQVFVVPQTRNIKAKSLIMNFFKEHGKNYDVLWCNKCELFNINYLIGAKKYHIKKIILHSHSSSNMHTGLRKCMVELLHQKNKCNITKYVTDYWACSDYAAKWMFPNKVIKDVKYIPNAIDTDKFLYNDNIRREIRKRLNIEKELVFGFIGSLYHVKNPMFALDVFNEYYKLNKKSILLIAGAGNLENEILEKINTLECKYSVKLLGVRKDVPNLMQALDCLLLPSFVEGFPVVAVEAQASGLPIFASLDGITKQTKLTEGMHLLSLSLGASEWAKRISQTDLKRYDGISKLKNKGFDIKSAAKDLLDRFG